MGNFRRLFSVLCVGLTCFAQSPEVSIQERKPYPVVGWFLKPFHIQPRIVGPALLSNTPRLEGLVRSGNLYLSLQDVIACALENNRLDIYDATSGKYLRSVDPLGLTPSVLITP